MLLAKALLNLRPEAQFVIDGNTISGIEWLSPDIDMPTEAEINAELGKLEQELVDTQYQKDRKAEYPDIGDQLDDLFKAGAFSTEMTAIIQAVKDKFPKE